MRIGITYDLKDDYLQMGFSEEEAAEFDKPETIEGIELALQKNGYQTERIGNIKQLIPKLHDGCKWDMVFNICEGFYGIGREAQVPALLDAYQIPYVFSDVLVLSLTLHKGMTKRVIRDAGVPTADFEVVEYPGDAEKVNLPFPLFAKPVAEGTGKGIDANSKIANREQLLKTCSSLLEKFKQPVLVETFLPGREFTVGIVGTGQDAKVVGVMEIELLKTAEKDVYSYFNKENYVGRVNYSLCTDEMEAACGQVALQAWNALGCRDGGRIDLRCDANGIPNFIEVNPLAGLNFVHSDLPILAYKKGYTYTQLIEMIMNSAIKRIHYEKQ